MTAPSDPLFLTFQQFADRIGRSRRTVINMVDAGQVVAVLIHRQRMIPADELQRLRAAAAPQMAA